MAQHEKAKEILEELNKKLISFIKHSNYSKAVIILCAAKTYWDLWSTLDYFNFLIERDSFHNKTEDEIKTYNQREKIKEDIKLHINLLIILNSER